jgi:phospholipid/cholesterol/gamma-HCH transport system permease protein
MGGSVGVSNPVRESGRYAIERAASDTLCIRLEGSWRLAERLPSSDAIEQALAADPAVRRVVLDGSAILSWDTGLVALVMNVLSAARARGIALDSDGLPPGVQRLIRLATTVPEEHIEHPRSPAWVGRVGLTALTIADTARAFVRFLGECAIALARFARGRARFLWIDVAQVIQDCGPSALPIVTLISFLVGLILAFMGAVQLRTFGAQIYVADLVAIATTREMGCLMTGIIMAGRTGAAFAAQLGTMQVNEEIDALTTMGLRPLEFLVLPRMLALVAMMPLLTVYSDVVAILGGAVVGVTVLDLNATQYLERTLHALTLTHFVVGIIKGTVFGILVALSGCLRGMRAGRSAADVGLATTSAVVTAIVLIVVTEGLFAVVLNALGF